MSDPVLGLTMLGLIVVAIMMGFPTAFTLMGLGMIFGYIAFWAPGQHWYDNRIFDLIVQRTYGVMTNDTLLSIPLFVYMGYIMERAALIDQMFHSVQVAFRRVPASLAVREGGMRDAGRPGAVGRHPHSRGRARPHLRTQAAPVVGRARRPSGAPLISPLPARSTRGERAVRAAAF